VLVLVLVLLFAQYGHLGHLGGRLGGMRLLFDNLLRLGRRSLFRRLGLRPLVLALGGGGLKVEMARDLGARSEALSLRRWGQGGAG